MQRILVSMLAISIFIVLGMSRANNYHDVDLRVLAPLRGCWPNTGRNRSPTLQTWQCHCQVVNGIKNGADDGDDVVLVETGEAIDPWPDIDFNWRLEVQLCADKAKNHQRPIKGSSLAGETWLMSEAQRCDKKITEKIAWLCHANQRHRRFKEIYQRSCFSKTILMNMAPPSYTQIHIRTDISNFCCRERVMKTVCRKRLSSCKCWNWGF